MDDGTGIKINISIERQLIMLVLRLEAASLLARSRGESGVKGDLQALGKLVLHRDLSSKCVVRVPLLSDGQTILGHLILGLQVSRHLAGIRVGGAAGGELDAASRLSFALQLEQAEVVALTEDIAGGLSQVGVDWRGHVCGHKSEAVVGQGNHADFLKGRPRPPPSWGPPPDGCDDQSRWRRNSSKKGLSNTCSICDTARKTTAQQRAG